MKWNHIVVLAVCSLQLIVLLAACRLDDSSEPAAASGSPEPTAEMTEPAPTEAIPTKLPVVITSPATDEPAIPTPAPTLTAAPEPTAPAPTATRPSLGDSGRPIQLLFPPVSSSAVIVNRAGPLAEALRQATGAEFAVGITDSEEALVALLCSAPADTIGFLTAAAYTIARDQCEAQPALVAVQGDGLTWQMGMIVVRPGAAGELADLDGRSWSVADTHSLPNYLYFRARMAEEGIEPGEIVEAPEETSALLALRNGDVDFTTASYVPPIMPLDREWIVGETEPEVWRLLGIAPSRSPIGYVIVAGEPEFGGYRIRDARSRLFDTTADIFDATRILSLSEPFPNDTVVFGADLPPAMARQVATTMTEFVASDGCGASLCSADLFGWAGLEPADDAAYDPIRKIKDTLELEAADLWAELD